MPLQPPFLQLATSTPPMRTERIFTFQNPSLGIATGAQDSGPINRSELWPPTASSLCSPCSPSLKKKPKLALFFESDPAERREKKLNSLDNARLSSPKPNIPSNLKDSKGCADISTATTMFMVVQILFLLVVSAPGRPRPTCCFVAASACAGTPKHTESCTNSPVTVPVP